jgi:iron complex outermembrane receptor protein
LGVKIEDDPYSGVTSMPSARVGWHPLDGMFLWSAVSRAIRSPTPFDADVVEKLGTAVFLTGNPDFDPEGLTAYELGYRGVLGRSVSVSVSGYWDVYDHLRSIELSPAGGLPLHWGNAMRGRVYGVDAWADIQLFPWWRLSPGLSALGENLHFEAGASGLLGVAQAGDDPHFRASLRSRFDISKAVTFDMDLRYTGRRSDPVVAAYTEMNAALTWNALQHVQLYLSGANLLHAQHVEYSPGDEISRSVTAGARWRF